MLRLGETTAQSGSVEPAQHQGVPLPEPVRAEMEPRLQHDFSRVRVHADESAARSARDLSARAFTVGQHIYFGRSRYQPETATGQQLLAHELTHVVQQRQGPERVQRRPDDSLGGTLDGTFEGDPFEGDALEEERKPWRRRPGGTLSYREAQRLTIPPGPPAAARLPDQAVRVVPASRAMFGDLRTYLAALPPRLTALLAAGNPQEPWLTAQNPFIASALRVLDQLNADLVGPSISIRFDHPAAAKSAAAYDFANNQMHIRAFAGDEQRTMVAVDMLHEYAHILQDRAAEDAFARSLQPTMMTKGEDLQHEIDARRDEVYFGELLRELGEPVPTSELLGAQLNARVFRGQFERSRVSPATKDAKAATAQIRTRLESEYAAQLATNSSVKKYAVEITANNHAVLISGLPGNDRIELGEMPAALTNRQQLESAVRLRITALAEFRQLFNLPGGNTVQVIMISVVHGGQQLAGFALN